MKDSTGHINAKLWNNTNIFDSRFKSGDLVAVKGIVLVFRKVNFLEILSIKKAEKNIFSEYKFNFKDLILNNSKNDNKWKKIFFLLNAIKNKHIKNLIMNIYNKNKTILFDLSNSYDKNGYYESYLEHLVNVLEMDQDKEGD